jgi:N-glycosidase YbiA
MIAELTGEFRYLSNFWTCFIKYEGITYPSVENAYQAAKCKNPKDREKFTKIKSSEAKRLGRIVEIRDGWNAIRISIMYDLLKQKFSSDPLKWMLASTQQEEIQEGNWWGDTFWGTVNGKGENHLGKLLMRVRDEILI